VADCYIIYRVLERYRTVTATVTEELVLRFLLEDRGRITESIRILIGARRQNETKIFSDHDETSPSIAAVSAHRYTMYSTCSMLAVQQQKQQQLRYLVRHQLGVLIIAKVKTVIQAGPIRARVMHSDGQVTTN